MSSMGEQCNENRGNILYVKQRSIGQVPLVDDSPADSEKDEVTKQSPSLSKLMFGNGKATAPTFNSPDRSYNRQHNVTAPSNGSVTSPSKIPGESGG